MGTLAELKDAGMSKKEAQSIGISIDALQLNVQRLKEYKAKLILFPIKASKPRKGDASEEDMKKASQLLGRVMPLKARVSRVRPMEVTEDMKKFKANQATRQARAYQKLHGIREKRKREAEEDDVTSWYSRIIELKIQKLCFSAQFIQEVFVGDETILIFLGCQFIKHLEAILFGDLISKIAQDIFKLSHHHGTIIIFVVQFAQLHVVMVVSRVFWLLDSLVHKADDLIELAEFLVDIIGLTELDSNFLGDVHAKSIEDIHEVVHIKYTFAIPVIDFTDFSSSSSINHDELFIDFSPQKTANERPTLEPSRL